MYRWRIHRGASGERGQTLVLVGIMLFVLLGVAAMAVDVGEVLWSRGTQQNAADAAALAGVRNLPDNPALAVDVALDYATSNGFTTGTNGVTVTAEVGTIYYPNDALIVNINRVVPPGLRAAVGAGEIEVPARAVAIVTSVQPLCDIFPMVLQEHITVTLDGVQGEYRFDELYGVEVVIKMGNTASPGNFGLLSLLDPGGAAVRAAFADGGVCISADDVDSLGVKTGGTVGPVLQGFQDLVETTNPLPWPPSWPLWSNGVPDNVYWATQALGESPVPIPWGLGSPSGNDSGCSGNGWESMDDRPVVSSTCPRVGFIPIIADDGWPTGSSDDVVPIDWAVFYVIAASQSDKTVTGAFLEKVTDVSGIPTWGDPSSSDIVGFFLWE